mmetsp:Transcript_17315/g.28962  ORF Transcript_17315/g.28962 Transcript_17315/m.28962 type:complete len:223 (+) Transcript_17315:73-741(+)
MKGDDISLMRGNHVLHSPQVLLHGTLVRLPAELVLEPVASPLQLGLRGEGALLHPRLSLPLVHPLDLHLELVRNLHEVREGGPGRGRRPSSVQQRRVRLVQLAAQCLLHITGSSPALEAAADVNELGSQGVDGLAADLAFLRGGQLGFHQLGDFFGAGSDHELLAKRGHGLIQLPDLVLLLRHVVEHAAEGPPDHVLHVLPLALPPRQVVHVNSNKRVRLHT